MELLQTESSYLRNLNTIIKVYKEPLEKALESGNPLMSQKDIESAFGGLPAIVALHSQIHEDLKDLIDDWQEDCCIADVITKYEDQLLTVYPPYVNYFDWGKELILKQQKSNADLRNFFTDCFNKPESLKQPLDALLIRPVQRLPSMSLLINDLHKRTASNLPDHNQLDNAKRVLKKVLSHINEDKRKTEGKMKIFDIVYQVDNCPIEVVSGNRLFISRIEVTTLSDGLYRSGERLALYLLTDKLEVAKWRNRSHGKSALLLKHIDLMSLCNIEQVMDVRDGGDGCENMFAVKYKVAATPNNGEEEKLSVLQSLDSSIYKQQWVTSFATQVAEMKGNDVTSDDIIRKIDPHDLANMLKKGSKLYKKLKASKSKSD